MKNLDSDGNGMVSAAELEAGNVKVIQTNADGTQKIVNASDVFTNADWIPSLVYG